ncbi:nitroreductase family protein [Bifidobacterium simiiventris]|uniref:nitroreductase family protein n=1 Tax=Bifidobacterium simiiventris TaxID=2834434 RepID=UPI001C5747B3|nr:nitroreductase family protein [Bifidobacterium simiiventris]MBW3079554.1 nitroreductase family protein [Bifidobacterium simiiventris]
MSKQAIKKILPGPILKSIQLVLRKYYAAKESSKLIYETNRQRRRFSRYWSRPDSRGRGQIETQILFHTHQIEKGLSHADFRPGFGKGVIKSLSVLLPRLEQADPTAATGFVYRQALSALHAYIEKHESIGFNLSYMKDMFPTILWEKIEQAQSNLAGALIIDRSTKAENRMRDFKSLSEHRFAIREFDLAPVNEEELHEAVSISMKTPSVCNRQATRVYEILNPKIIQKLLDIQGGYRGYPTPPALIFITSDVQAFMNHAERNEPFVDGGLFSMSLLYSLEYIGLAACPLNAMFDKEQDRQTREILHVPDYELPIMYIAVGHYPEQAHVCMSHRYSTDQITTIIR